MQDPERVLGVHRDRPGGRAEPIAFVAKRKPASTVSGEQSDRQLSLLSAGASRETGP